MKKKKKRKRRDTRVLTFVLPTFCFSNFQVIGCIRSCISIAVQVPPSTFEVTHIFNMFKSFGHWSACIHHIHVDGWVLVANYLFHLIVNQALVGCINSTFSCNLVSTHILSWSLCDPCLDYILWLSLTFCIWLDKYTYACIMPAMPCHVTEPCSRKFWHTDKPMQLAIVWLNSHARAHFHQYFDTFNSGTCYMYYWIAPLKSLYWSMITLHSCLDSLGPHHADCIESLGKLLCGWTCCNASKRGNP